MQQVFQTANPNSNLELSIKQANGAAVPNWLSLNMGPISLINSYNLGISVSDVRLFGKYAYLPTQEAYARLVIVDINNVATPLYTGICSQGSKLAIWPKILLKENYAYISNGYRVSIINITTPSCILNNIINASPLDMTLSGNYLYLYSSSNNENEMMTISIYDITDPFNPIVAGSVDTRYRNVNSNYNYHINCISVSGNYANAATGNTTAKANVLSIVDVINPFSPSLVKQLTLSDSSNIGAVLAQGNKLFLAAGTSVQIYDITESTNPVLLRQCLLVNCLQGN